MLPTLITQTKSLARQTLKILVVTSGLLLLTAACMSAEPASGPASSRDYATSSEGMVSEEAVASEEGATGEYTVSDAAPAPSSQSPNLRAGEVDDNLDWDAYLNYRLSYQDRPIHNRDISERYIIDVEDASGLPILDATVQVYASLSEVSENDEAEQLIYEAKTYADGRVLFHPKALGFSEDQVDSFQVKVTKNDAMTTFTLPRIHAQEGDFTDRWTVNLDLSQQATSVNLDLLFLIDATGSMADEIHAIQSTVFDVAARIDDLPERPDVRYGLVTYRDRGDAFISRVYGFTDKVVTFSENLDTVQADGGGDEPESLNQGLHDALHTVTWRQEDTVRIIFLIADAPPHLDYEDDFDYALDMEIAAQEAIKIFPIASSGLDNQGEYVFRQLAQFTQGRFVFLTYATNSNGGAPGDKTTHHVDEYSVSNLDDLLVKLVTEELAHQNPLLAQVDLAE